MAATHSSGEVLYDYLRRSGALGQTRPRDRRRRRGRGTKRRPFLRARAQPRVRCSRTIESAFLAPALELDKIEDDRDPDATERDAVRVLTVHRAKGLEFDTVFICGLVDGRFPVRSRPPVLSLPDELLGNADEQDQALAEERRLFYVALTRARDEVVLTSHDSGPQRTRTPAAVDLHRGSDRRSRGSAGAGQPRSDN